MNKLRSLINEHPLISFVVVAYGFSWGLWWLMISLTGHINWLGSFGPSLAAILLTVIGKGRAGLKTLLNPIKHWRFGPGWYFFVLIGCVLLFLLGLWGFILFGGIFYLSGDKILNQLVQTPIFYLIILIIGGPLGEEIGWRGFVLPQLLKSKNVLISSAILFVVWFAWHLPLFWLPGASQYGSPIVPYLIFFAAWSILFTWVYLGTSGSLLSALLLHTSINTYSNFMSGVDPAHADNPLLAYGIASALFAIVVLFTYHPRFMIQKSNVA